MRSPTLNGTDPTRRDWVRYRSGTDGVELLEASFDQHVYERHIHETYAIGGEPHDSWVVGDRPYVSLHFLGAEGYAR